jgi:hypothetical protein
MLNGAGDVRMQFAEDSRKVNRIVEGSVEQFQGMYSRSYLQDTFAYVGLDAVALSIGEPVQFSRCMSRDSQVFLIQQLPWVRFYEHVFGGNGAFACSGNCWHRGSVCILDRPLKLVRYDWPFEYTVLS